MDTIAFDSRFQKSSTIDRIDNVMLFVRQIFQEVLRDWCAENNFDLAYRVEKWLILGESDEFTRLIMLVQHRTQEGDEVPSELARRPINVQRMVGEKPSFIYGAVKPHAAYLLAHAKSLVKR